MNKSLKNILILLTTLIVVIMVLNACATDATDDKDTVVTGCNHSVDRWTITTKSTCVSEGTKEGVCTLCGETVEEQIPITKPHIYTKCTIITEPTCTTSGKAQKTCVNCGKVVTVDLAATGHKVSEYNVVTEPTCTETGLEVGTCSVCGKSVEKQLAKVEHVSDDNYVITQSVDSSGHGVKSAHCINCGAELKEDYYIDLTLEDINAIKKAKSYLRHSSFSRSRLIKQLEFEGYSTEASTLAVDNIVVDWYEQAALRAQSYMRSLSFSRSGLIHQLEYEGFTTDQAEYGATSVGY